MIDVETTRHMAELNDRMNRFMAETDRQLQFLTPAVNQLESKMMAIDSEKMKIDQIKSW